MERPRRWIELAGIAGMLGPVLFAAVSILLTYSQYDFMRSLGWDTLRAPTFDWPSGLSLGLHGWLMIANFLIGGGMISFFALGLRQTLGQTRPAKIGASLLTLAGLALMALAFPTDPTLRSTPARSVFRPARSDAAARHARPWPSLPTRRTLETFRGLHLAHCRVRLAHVHA